MGHIDDQQRDCDAMGARRRTLDGAGHITVWFHNFVAITHGQPDEEETPTNEQLSALNVRVVVQLGSPYADFAVFTPYARKTTRAHRFTAYLPQPDGSWLAKEIPGPTNFQAWLYCWRVFRVACLMLKVAHEMPLDNVGWIFFQVSKRSERGVVARFRMCPCLPERPPEPRRRTRHSPAKYIPTAMTSREAKLRVLDSGASKGQHGSKVLQLNASVCQQPKSKREDKEAEDEPHVGGLLRPSQTLNLVPGWESTGRRLWDCIDTAISNDTDASGLTRLYGQADFQGPP